MNSAVIMSAIPLDLEVPRRAAGPLEYKGMPGLHRNEGKKSVDRHCPSDFKIASKCLLSKDYSLHIHSISEGSAQSGPDDNFRRETNSTGNLKPRHKWSADPDG